jgi:hypothetical protein
VERGGYAGFVVSNISGNGSPLIRKRVQCSASAHRTRYSKQSAKVRVKAR